MNGGPNRRKPPALIHKFLTWFCKEDLLEEVEGDLEEEYYERVERSGRLIASVSYLIDVLLFLKPFAVKKNSVYKPIMTDIFANYLKVSFRNLKRDKLNTFIGVFGLSIAVTSAAVIYIVTSFETSFDQYHKKAGRIYRINYDALSDPARNYIIGTVGPPLGPAIKSAYTEIENSVRFRTTNSTILRIENENTSFYEDKVVYTDPSVFQIFDFPLKLGDPTTALSQPNNIVLTSELATKYFGNKDPLGRVMIYGEEPFQVTGVLEPIPSNTSFTFSALLPFDAFKVPFGYPVTLESWGWISFHVYVLLRPGVNAAEFESRLPEFANQHFDAERASNMHYRLQPLKEIYFGEVKNEYVKSGNYTDVLILYSVAILILLLAVFNFTNLSLAKAITKAKESGLRKTLGTGKFVLWVRYLFEPILMSFMGTGLAILVIPLIIPHVVTLFNLPIVIDNSYWFILVPIALLSGLALGFFSGIYPAFLMTAFQPSVILKGNFSRSASGMNLRKILLTLQFTITSFLIVGSFVISKQINFLQSKDLGFDKEKILLLRMPGEVLNANYRELRTALMQDSRVVNVSVGGGRMDAENGNVPIYADGSQEPINLPIDAVREEFFATIGTNMIAGREFSFEFPSDSLNSVVINEEAAKRFGWSPEEALGKRIRVFDLAEGQIIGVVQNFNSTSLHNNLQPLVISYPRTHLSDVYIRVNSEGNFNELLSNIESKFHTLYPQIPFDYMWMSDNLSKLYRSDTDFARLVNVFGIITILISVLGLYGLVTLVSQQRLKEIGIRKVLGAGFGSLIVTLSKSFLIIIVIANLVSWPISFWVSDQWLNSFAFRIDISLYYFMISLILTLAIAQITLLIQTVKTISVNPVTTLRYD